MQLRPIFQQRLATSWNVFQAAVVLHRVVEQLIRRNTCPFELQQVVTRRGQPVCNGLGMAQLKGARAALTLVVGCVALSFRTGSLNGTRWRRLVHALVHVARGVCV